MIELQEDNLQDIVGQNNQVIVQYGASWCGNCRLVKPKFKRLATETEGTAFVYVDAEKLPNSRAMAEVKNLPTFAGFKNGKLITQVAGSKIDSANEVLNAITTN